VPDNWRAYFDALQNVPAADGSERRDVAHAPVVESFAQRAKANAFAPRRAVPTWRSHASRSMCSR
jgi:2-oxoglutarate dehydrogenase E1 component